MTKLIFQRFRVAGAIVFLGGSLSGCVLHCVSSTPGPVLSGNQEENKKFVNAPGKAVETTFPSGPWWETFGDLPLERVVDLALEQNPDVRAVSRRIDQAGARMTQAGSTLYPQFDGAGHYRRSRNLDGEVKDEASLGLLFNWELDLWGRIRSGRSARTEEYASAVEDWYAARLFLTTAVAEAWFGLQEQYLQRQLVDQQIGLNRTLLGLTRLRFGQGQGSSVDVLQQQQQLEATETLRPDIDARVDEFELALNALTGNVSGTPRIPSGKELADLPPLPETGFPSGLLELRPDLRSQRSRIRAVDHEVGEAMADCLPRFSIGGSVAFAGTPTLEALVADAVAGALGPIFDAGSRKAEVARRKSRVMEEIDLYTGAYLNAVQEVETALSREREISRRLVLQEKQLATARELLNESRVRYSRGLNDYLPVLDAVSRVQQLERDLLTSRRERLSARIALHRAMGGPMPDPEGGEP